MIKLLGKSRRIEAKETVFKLSGELSSEKVLTIKEQVSLIPYI